jgi:hypothetical protein
MKDAKKPKNEIKLINLTSKFKIQHFLKKQLHGTY